MAIHDTRSQFADAAALPTSGTGVLNVGNVYDQGTRPGSLGTGKPAMALVIQVTTAVTSGGAATVEFDLVSDAVNPPAVDGSASVHLRTPAIPKATLVVGYRTVLPLPPGVYERYLGVQQVVGVAALTAGAIDAFLVEAAAAPGGNTPPASETGGL